MAAYTEEVTEEIFHGIDSLSVRVRDVVREHAPVRTGRYRRAISVKKDVYKSRYNKKNVVHVNAPHYRLSHLIENGHLVAGGTKRVPPHPHFSYGEELAKSEMQKIVREAAKP